MDKLTKEQRHRCMFAIKNKNTKPELWVRKLLFSREFRYRLNYTCLPRRDHIRYHLDSEIYYILLLLPLWINPNIISRISEFLSYTKLLDNNTFEPNI